MLIDGIELTLDELESWQEKFSICHWQGAISADAAEKIADERVRKMRKRYAPND